MASKLAPPNPDEVMVIRKVTDNITTLSVPFKRFGRINIGGRASLVRLPTGSVAVFSPVALTPKVKETVSGMGELKYIIAPDMEHHIFLTPWHEAYPQAKVLGPAGLAEKRAKSNESPVPFAVEYKDTDTAPNSVSVDADFDAAFDSIYVPAHANKELVYNYRPDRTLIEADLMFNLPATEQMSRTGEKPPYGFLTKQFAGFTNTQGEALGQRRMIWYGTSSKDRVGFGKSVASIAGWDFDKLIPCHGDVIESGAKGIFEKVMKWHLDGTKKPW